MGGEGESLININLDDLSEQAPAASREESDGARTSTSEDSKAVNEKISTLEESNKNLQEQLRQQSEEMKPFKEFFDRVTGNTEDEKKKIEAQNILRKFEEDPIGVTNELIKKNLVPLEDAFLQNVSQSRTKEAMSAIDRKFKVDWGKHSKKIVENLAKFSLEQRKKDPEGILEAACKLAGALPEKSSDKELPVVEETIRPGSRPAPKEHEDKVNERMNSFGKRKKDNIFGI